MKYLIVILRLLEIYKTNPFESYFLNILYNFDNTGPKKRLNIIKLLVTKLCLSRSKELKQSFIMRKVSFNSDKHSGR